MTNKKVYRLSLHIQEAKSSEGTEIDIVSGTLFFKPEDKKKKKNGRVINFQTTLSSNTAFEKHINRIIKEACQLDFRKE